MNYAPTRGYEAYVGRRSTVWVLAWGANSSVSMCTCVHAHVHMSLNAHVYMHVHVHMMWVLAWGANGSVSELCRSDHSPAYLPTSLCAYLSTS